MRYTKKKIVQNYFNNLSKTHWFYEYLFREHYASQKKGLWSTWWQLTIICEDGLSVNTEHYDKTIEIKKKNCL